MFLAAVVVGLEALAAAAFGLVAIVRIDTAQPVVGVGVALLMLGYGAFLIAISRGLALERRWSRGAAVATQLLQALLAYSFWQGPTWPVGLVLGGLAVAALGCLFTPAANAVFADREPPGQD